ncbi:glutamate 5-kinase [Desulfovibrio ferrophilus]|uniref:Glutamate 5-kinase n=1 Tax=Desulfovibrio ferrophilus TaxID=241368 RepID=A0A2Z6B378_9BACT|nr:glutamate 5-kinase [Desulfovibrio ferrophilus]BBD09969.1 gamma-glutamyl kinase [Desulfovibrio ferrophilus]
MGWRKQRTAVMKAARRVVIKVGSAVLTGPEGLDLRIVSRLADQLADLHDQGLDVVLVSSGAVAAGRRRVKVDIDGMPARQAASAIGQSRLMHAYDEAFERYGKTSAQILLTRDDLKSRKRFLNVLNTFRTLLDWRVIPVVNENDTVSVQELKFGDNDSLASLVVNLVDADLYVNLTSAKGVFDSNPDNNPDAKCLPCIENICAMDLDSSCDGKTTDGTGGMYSKLLAARRTAQLGVPTLILSGHEFYGLKRVFEGEELGTWIVPDGKSISSRKFWLAYNNQPEGVLTVDPGASAALVNRGKSLLPAGITAVDGDFGEGALVRITDPGGDTLGVGLVNYAAADIVQIMGRKSADIASILGSCPYPEAIHRDNLLLDAAV